MQLKVLTHRFSCNISRTLRLVWWVGLVVSLLWHTVAPRPRAASIAQSALRPMANTMQSRTDTTQDDSRAGAERLKDEALNLFQRGDVESRREAIKKLEAALAIWRSNGDRAGEANTLFAIGRTYSSLGEEQKALDFYNQALPLHRTVGNRAGEANTLNNIGLVYNSLGGKGRALDFYNQALLLDRAIGDHMGEAIILYNIGSVYSSLGEKQKALDFYNQSLPLHRAVINRAGEANTLNNIGRVYSSLGEKRRALDFYNQALQLYRTIGDREGEATTLDNIGKVYAWLGEKQKALDSYNQALPLYRAVGNREGEARMLNIIGSVYGSLGERQKALDFYNQALPLWRAVGDRAGEATTLNNIGLVYDSLGEKQKALDFYNQTLPLHRAVNDREGEAATLNNIALVYASLDERQKALDFYNQALPLSRAVGNQIGEAATLDNIGRVYASLGEKQKALDSHNQALLLDRAIGDRAGEAITLNDIGSVYGLLGEKQKALDFFNQALPLHRAVGNRTGEATTLDNVGLVYFTLGEKQKALDFCNQALALLRAVGDYAGEATTLSNIAYTERKLGRLDEARAHSEASLLILESLRTKIERQDLRSSYFAMIQSPYEFHVDLLMQMHRREPTKGHLVAALQANERSRARAFLDSLVEGRAEIRQGVDAALLAREKSVQQRLNAKAEEQLKRVVSAAPEAQIAALKKEIETLTDELEQVRTQIRQTSPRYAALTQPQPLTAAEIQQQVLDADTLLLEYALGEERSFVWAVTPTTLNSYELPRRAEIEAAALRVYQLLAAPNRSVRGETPEQRSLRLQRATGQYAEAAAQLSRMLLAPVAAELGRKRLVIVADGALHTIPFGALPVPVTNNRAALDDLADKWKIVLPTSKPSANLKSPAESAARSFTPLIVNHEIINLPSASTLAVSRRELAGRKPAPQTLAVLADPVFTADDVRVKTRANQPAVKPDDSVAGLMKQRILKQLAEARDDLPIARLPFTRQEAEQILALVPPGAGMKALDFEASRATALSEQLSQYRYVHFATHGLADSERAELSTIVLSLFDEQGKPQEGFLRAHEVYNLNLPAELVVLSACETGLGQAGQGRGVGEPDARLYVRGRGARGGQFVERE